MKFVKNPIYRLPPYKIDEVFKTLAQTVDYGHALTGVPSAWKRSRGRGVKIAILDTGIDLKHQDLQGQVVAYRNFTSSKTDDVADRQGHGTHCAGIIAGIDNQTGIVGVCPDLAKDGGGLFIGKVLGDDGSGSDSGIAAGIRWAIAQGVHLISMSLGSARPSADIKRAIQEAEAAGIFVICAAGNDGRPDSVNYPARFPETIAVSAVDNDGNLADYSSWGKEVDIAAPGSNVLSCMPGNKYAEMSGTSMATPYVAGVVGLMLSVVKSIKTISQLRDRLQRTAEDRGAAGVDPQFGFGLIDANKIVGRPYVFITPK